MKVVQYADAGYPDGSIQPALTADVQRLRAKRPAPRLVQDPSVDADLEVGVNLDVVRGIVDLDAIDAAHVRSGSALLN